MDLEKFFDRVNHDLLMEKLSKKISDGRVLRLIRRYLEAGMMADGRVSQRTQGGPLSPLLSNILLTERDRELDAGATPSAAMPKTATSTSEASGQENGSW